jgi:hypothetical protein
MPRLTLTDAVVAAAELKEKPYDGEVSLWQALVRKVQKSNRNLRYVVVLLTDITKFLLMMLLYIRKNML